MYRFIFLVFFIFSFPVQASLCESSFAKNPIYKYINHFALQKSEGAKVEPNINFRKVSAQHFIDFFKDLRRYYELESKKIKNDEYKELEDVFTGIHRMSFMAGAGYDLFSFISVAIGYSAKEKNQISVAYNHFLQFSIEQDIYDKLDKLYKKTYHQSKLSQRQKKMIRATIDSFFEEEHQLKNVKKIRSLYKKMWKDMGQLKKSFKEKMNWISLNEKGISLLRGVDKKQINSYKRRALSEGKKNQYHIKLNFKTATLLLKQASERSFRKRVYNAYFKQQDRREESALIQSILKGRQKIAKEEGYKSYAEYYWADDNILIKTPQNIMSFLKGVIHTVKLRAQKDIDELESQAQKLHGIDRLEPWDLFYYNGLLNYNGLLSNKEKVQIKIPVAMEVMLEHFEKLLNFEFRENKTFPSYSEDVMVYDVYYQNKKKGLVIFDLFENKFIRSQKLDSEGTSTDLKPFMSDEFSVVAIKTYFDKKKGFLNTYEVSVLFHEMGHAAQTFLEREKGVVPFQSVDQQEFHSMLQELLMQEENVLNLFQEKDTSAKFSRHSLKVKSSRYPGSMNIFIDAYKELLNLVLHSEIDLSDLKKIEKDLIKSLKLPPFLEKYISNYQVSINLLAFNHYKFNEESSYEDASELDNYSYLYSTALAGYLLNQYVSKDGIEQKSIYNYKLRKKLLSLYRKSKLSLKDVNAKGKDTISNKELVRVFMKNYLN